MFDLGNMKNLSVQIPVTPTEQSSERKSELPEPIPILEDCIRFLEFTAIDDCWSEDYYVGWTMLNKCRSAIGKKPVTPVNSPSLSHMRSFR